MDFEKTLEGRVHLCDIRRICAACTGPGGDEAKNRLLALAFHHDDRTGYNALWVFTHLPAPHRKWLQPHRNELVEQLLHTGHAGRQRLLLTLLEMMPVEVEDVRTDYLDFCLSRINSAAPAAIRAFCLKQAFALCRFYPELLDELSREIELMQCSALSPGLLSARKNILKKMEYISKTGLTR